MDRPLERQQRRERDDGELTPEFIAAAEAVNRALARAVAEEVEDQLTDVLMCLGEETTKVEVLSYALARGFGVEVPQLLREAGYSPDASPARFTRRIPHRRTPPKRNLRRPARRSASGRVAVRQSPPAERATRRGVTRIGNSARGSNAGRRVGGASLSVVGGDADPRTSGTSGTPGTSGTSGTSGTGADFSTPAGLPSAGLPSAGPPPRVSPPRVSPPRVSPPRVSPG